MSNMNESSPSSNQYRPLSDGLENFNLSGDHPNADSMGDFNVLKKPSLESLSESVPSSNEIESSPNMEVILNIPVTVSMEVGNTQMSIRNLLQLNQGSVVELDRLAGDALDVLVNGTLIAHGEVVVVNDKFGIRLTDIVSPSERINRLR